MEFSGKLSEETLLAEVFNEHATWRAASVSAAVVGATETFTVMSPSQPRSRPHERKRIPGVALAREVAIG